MIESSLYFIDRVNKEFDLIPKRVADIGSMDRNLKIGARAQFPDSEYMGIDMEEGPNVDVIADVYKLNKRFAPGRFDAVLCLHLFEHLARPWLALEQIDYVLVDLGLLYVSMPTIGYPVHDYPGDYWRCTEQSMKEVIMDGYEVLSIEQAKSTYNKHPFINCLGRKL
jgi:predicted SAM-dependent methyltransferase